MNKNILIPSVTACFLYFLFSHSVFATEQNKKFQVKAAQYLVPERAASMEMKIERRALRTGWNLDNSRSFQLNALSKAEQDKIVATDDRGRQRIGIVRDIPADQAVETETLVWDSHADGGKIAIITASSPGAAALRLGIYVEKIEPETELRFFSYDSQGKVPPILVTGADILKLIQMNLKAEPDNPNARLYWSPSINGDKAGVEIYLPVGFDPEQTEIQLKKISHRFDSSSVALESFSALADTVDTPCYNDVVCYPDLFKSRSAIAKIEFVDDGVPYSCTGTLLNDSDDSTWIPYFITANHCIDSQSTASSLEVFWNFESETCDGQEGRWISIKSGAYLLWTKEVTQELSKDNMDVTFLKIQHQPPIGTWFAGWLAQDVTEEANRTVHHPGRDALKKISFGSSRDGTYVCKELQEEGLEECISWPGGPFFTTDWLSGGVKEGSSGAGVFNEYEQLTGILSAATLEIPCDLGAGKIFTQTYGTNFKDAYYAGNLAEWLGDGSTASQSTSVGNIVPITALLLLGKSDKPSADAEVPLNDTGITWSGNYKSGNNTACVSSNTPDGDNVVAAQDCSHGRDATHNDDSDGHAGFSYTKLNSSGVPLANQNADYATTPWACVKDNVTGLIWEVKTDDGGLHDKDDEYNWYNTDPSTNGGADGYADDDGDICYGYNSGVSSTFCNTEAYVNRVNAAGWCGASDWRMPTRKELESIVSYDRYNPVIDTKYFSNAGGSNVWSGSPYVVSSDVAWFVNFRHGDSDDFNRNYDLAVRLVRGGQ